MRVEQGVMESGAAWWMERSAAPCQSPRAQRHAESWACGTVSHGAAERAIHHSHPDFGVPPAPLSITPVEQAFATF